MKKLLIAALVGFGLVSGANALPDLKTFKETKLSQVKIGTTTIDDLIAIFGNPSSVDDMRTGNGTQVLSWTGNDLDAPTGIDPATINAASSVLSSIASFIPIPGMAHVVNATSTVQNVNSAVQQQNKPKPSGQVVAALIVTVDSKGIVRSANVHSNKSGI